jgi:menaquinol-cytochrome c reductase iron-sulfur subunit
MLNFFRGKKHVENKATVAPRPRSRHRFFGSDLILPELYLILHLTQRMESRPCCAPEPVPRRSFLKKVLAASLSAVLGLVPVAAGLAVFFDPLRRKSAAGGPVRVTTLDSLPADGVPRKFPILSSRRDAWNKMSDVPIGAVYLRRTAGGVEALNVVCPHAGCPVDFLPARNGFLCPCHNSSFTVEGRIADPASPTPRALDSLPVEVRNDNEVWVSFQNFESGHAEKVPVS